MVRDPYKYFRIEARELLDQLRQGTLDLEKGIPAPDLVARLLRLAHTLKGAARVVKQREIADQAHAVEDALMPVRASTEPVSRDRIDSLLKLVDDLERGVVALTFPSAAGDSLAHVPPEELFRALRPDIHEMDALLNGVTEAHVQLASLRPQLDRAERARQLADLMLDQLASPAARERGHNGDRATGARVQSMAEELRAILDTFQRDVAHGIDQAVRDLREVRGAAERLQLVPARALFTILEQTARDTAQALGKRVVFKGLAGNVRVDARVLGVVQGALLQVVRNAVVHGIEPAADRRAAGKTPEGQVGIDVRRLGQRVVFACTDDGRGVDLEAVRRAARRKGFDWAQTGNLRSEELLGLLLKGGISTSGAVSEVSGRGIGLDVVREAAERLGGDVVVRTEADRGTTIELSVPLSLASFQALVVEASGITAILPFDAVRGSLRISPGEVVRTADGESIIYDGRSIPLASLTRVIAPDLVPVRAAGPSSAVVVQGRTGMAAFSVDRILESVNVVLRPLPDLAPAAPFVAGASLDEAGVPQLVLEPEGLIAAAERGLAAAEPDAARPSVLVIDDSLTTRMLEQSILESAGYDVDLASSGEEALEKARRHPYALFLVDVEMPGMDGFTFIERARTESGRQGIPSILVTSRSSHEDQRRGQEVGAAAYIVKSNFDQSALLDQIRRLVG